MRKIFGSLGSVSGLMLRMGQSIFSAASMWVILTTHDYVYMAFSYLLGAMLFQGAWSFVLGCLDVWALTKKIDLKIRPLMISFAFGDWVSAYISLAAACSAAGMLSYERDIHFSETKVFVPCTRYEIATGLAFIAWIFSVMSAFITTISVYLS